MRQLIQTIRSQIRYGIILPYLFLMILVVMAGSGIAIILVADSWQERFDNQMGQVARNFTEAYAQREINNIAFLGRTIYTEANPQTGAPAVAQALAERDSPGLEQAIEPLYRLGLQDEVKLDRLILFDTQGIALLDWERSVAASDEPIRYVATDLSKLDFVQRVLRRQEELIANTDVLGDKYSGLIRFRSADASDSLYFFTVVPVAVDTNGEEPGGQRFAGGMLVAARLTNLLQDLQNQSQSAVTTIYDVNGIALASTVSGLTLADLDMSASLISDVAALNERARNASGGTATTNPRSGGTVDACLDIGRLSGQLANVNLLQSNRLPACSIKDTRDIAERPYQFVYAPLLIRGVQAGYFSVSLSRDFVISAWSSSRWAIIAVTALLAIGAVVVGFVVAQQITRPLTELVETATAVTGGDLERRSQVNAPNELGKLSVAFNQMTAHLLRLYTVSRELNRSIEVEQVLDIATQSASSFAADTEALALLANDDGWSYSFGTQAAPRFIALAQERPSTLDPLFARFKPQAEPSITLLDLTLDPSPLIVALREHAGLQTALVDPLFVQDRLIGLLFLAHPQANAFSEADLQSLTVIANMSSTVLSNAVLFTQVQRDAKQRQAILESIGDGVIVCDDGGRIVLLNRVAEDMLEIRDWQTTNYHVDALPLEAMTNTRELFGRTAGSQFRVGERTVSRTESPVIDEESRVVGQVIVLHDITEAVMVDQAKTDFIATISHELRTPLTVIRGYTDLLMRGRDKEKLTDDQAELMEQVRKRAVDMTGLVNNAILIADIEAGKLITELQPQDVELVLGMALTPMRSAFEIKKLNTTLDLPADLPAVMADREHLKRAFAQILDNAYRYTDQGGVTVRARAEAGQVIIEFADTGQGISPEILPRLFKRFQRIEGNNSAQRGGGLGLAITKQLIELQGGQVEVSSTPGQGSTFTISLTQAQEQSLVVAQPDNTKAAS
jgi:signal transduction histidine kinase/HAMP domain-containing protein